MESSRPVNIDDILKVATDIINQSDYHDKEYITICLQNHEKARLSNIRFSNEINCMRWEENNKLKEELEALHKVLSTFATRTKRQIEVLQSELDDALKCCDGTEDND